jgi:hypothetical protein
VSVGQLCQREKDFAKNVEKREENKQIRKITRKVGLCHTVVDVLGF